MDVLPDAAYVYMVRCTGGQLYTGWTNHPAARLKAHQSGKGARYTRAHGAVGFAYLERCADKRAALRREAALKKLSKPEKEVLCAAWRAAGCPGVETIETPSGGRWRVVPDEGQHPLALHALSGAPAPALPRGEPSR